MSKTTDGVGGMKATVLFFDSRHDMLDFQFEFCRKYHVFGTTWDTFPRPDLSRYTTEYDLEVTDGIARPRNWTGCLKGLEIEYFDGDRMANPLFLVDCSRQPYALIDDGASDDRIGYDSMWEALSEFLRNI